LRSSSATPSPGDVCFRLEGPVSLDNLMDVRRAGEVALAAAGSRPAIDLTGLTNGNSAAVAVLMAWLRTARAQNQDLVFLGLPERLWKIIQLSGMAKVLPLQRDEKHE
jgi:phospholipid transport system transporter-binding protein